MYRIVQENHPGAARNTRPAERPELPLVGRDEGRPVRRHVDGWPKRHAAMTAMKVSTVATFTNTIAELKLADSRIPNTRIAVIIAITR